MEEKVTPFIQSLKEIRDLMNQFKYSVALERLGGTKRLLSELIFTPSVVTFKN